MPEKKLKNNGAALSSKTSFLRSLWHGFPRLRRAFTHLTGRSWGHWDGEAWQAVGPRLFGARTAVALDGQGHKLRVRLAQWVDLTSLIGRPEEAPVERVVKALPMGATMVDAGAHIGRYSLMAASAVGPAGRVIAIEPGLATFRLLRHNALLNVMSWITPVRVALGKEDGTAELFTGSDQATNSLRADWLDWLDKLEGVQRIARRGCQRVRIRSLPSLLTELEVGHVDLLKIDVEGAELEVLQGALDLLRSGQIKQLICAVHQPAVRQADVEIFLRNCGFVVKDLGNAEIHAVWDPRRRTPTQQSFRLAVVGCGAIAELAHIPAASRLDGVQVVALVDSDLARARQLASNYGVPRATASLEELVGHVDGVILATPPHVRSNLAQQALAQGFHVLCEKPLANSAAECRRMIAKAKDVGRLLAVAHTYRFFPNWIYARALYQSGRLGRLVSARIEQGSPYSWPTRTAYTLRREWVPGGVLFNEGVHVLDFLLWWFGTPERFDYEDDSLGGLESNVRLVFHYADGVEAHYRLSRTCALDSRIELDFEKAGIRFPLYDMRELDLTTPGGQRTRVALCPKSDFVEAVKAQLRDFARAATEGVPTTIPAEAGLAVLDLIESCYQSKARHARPEHTPLPGMTW
jgi:FkbM family methyltransferase